MNLISLVTETWFAANLSDVAVQLRGMDILRRDRGSRGGGVCLYIKRDTINVSVINTDLQVASFEFLAILIKKGPVRVCVLCIDRRHCRITMNFMLI